MNLSLDKTISSFIESEHYSTLISDPNVMMVYLGGSRCMGIVDEYSDYDLVILCRRYTHPIISHHYKELSDKFHMHAYIQTFEQLLTINTWGRCVGLLHMSVFKPSSILYINPKFTDCYDFIVNNRKTINLLGCSKLYRLYQHTIDKIVDSQYIDLELRRKLLYHWCYAYYSMTESDIDADFLNRVKRCRLNGLSDDDMTVVVETLTSMVKYFTVNIIDEDEIVSYLLSEYTSLFPGVGEI